MTKKECSTCKHWRLDRGTGKRICIGARSDEYGDYTAGGHKCLAWEPTQPGERKNNDTGNRG